MGCVSHVRSLSSGEPQFPLFPDLEHLDELVSGTVLVNSVLNIINSLGYRSLSKELASLLKEYVGRLLEALAVEEAYVPGLASFLAMKIRRRLWELETPDGELSEFLNMLIGYRIELARGRLGAEDAEELLRLTCHYLDVYPCERLRERLRSLTPALALQVALTGLAIAVGGVGV